MELTLIHTSRNVIASVMPKSGSISGSGDILDLMGSARYQGADGVIIREAELPPEFFDLRSGIAGEILQKFSNYQMKIAIVGEFAKYRSNALNAFIIECNRGKHIFFVGTVEEGMERLTSL
ncbi:MAG: DUF4180 domain-containing protein [Bacteroidetes bacterium]|nr:DUF4180 domain-containing protein [Bacteroidota bacterium]